MDKQTRTYVRRGEVALPLDVYPPVGNPTGRPCVVWIHGGALIMGSRGRVPSPLETLCRERGWYLVSLDYRLAPETRLPGILEDVDAALGWVRGDGAHEFGWDTRRLAVTGGSAGGYLTYWVGATLRPAPRCLVSYWGYGDLLGDWYTQPSEHYRRTVPLYTRQDALAGVGKGVPTGVESDPEIQKARARYYHYLRQTGRWPWEVSGFDPVTQAAEIARYCPRLRVGPGFPPTLMVHGTADTDVPYSCSAEMAVEFRRHGVTHELITVPDAEHGLAGADPALLRQVHERVNAFLTARLA